MTHLSRGLAVLVLVLSSFVFLPAVAAAAPAPVVGNQGQVDYVIDKESGQEMLRVTITVKHATSVRLRVTGGTTPLDPDRPEGSYVHLCGLEKFRPRVRSNWEDLWHVKGNRWAYQTSVRSQLAKAATQMVTIFDIRAKNDQLETKDRLWFNGYC